MPFKFPSIKKRIKKNTLQKVFLSLLVVFLIGASYFRIFDAYENILLDMRFRLRPSQQTHPKIVIIEVSDDTLRQLGYWPLPRDFHASLLDVLSYAGAKQVVFDFLFVEPTLEDKLFAESIKDAGNVYLPIVFDLDKNKSWHGLLKTNGIVAPIVPALEKVAKGIGYINSPRDSDGKVRWAPLLMSYKNTIWPHIALLAASDYLGIPMSEVKFSGNKILLGQSKTIPTDRYGRILVNYAATWGNAFKHYSYVDILASWKETIEGKTPRINLRELKDAVCFVGLTAAGTSDLHAVPLETNYPMVGLHANVLNSILLNHYVVRANRWINIFILLLLLAGVCLMTIDPKKRKPVASFLYTVLIGLIFIAFGCGVFVFFGFWIDLFYPLAMMVLMYTGVRIYLFLKESRERELIEKELSIAKQIQESFLPEPLNAFHGLKIAASMTTAKHVGGDLYDIKQLDEDRLGVLIGDVSGKGVAASLTMAKAISIFRVIISSTEGPGELLRHLNEEIAKDMKPGVFVTATYLIYNANTKEVTIASAGHSPTPIFHKDGNFEKIEPKEGLPLGLMGGVDFSEESMRLKEGDIIALYTDGVSEAKNLKRDEFGDQRLSTIITNHLSSSPTELVHIVGSEINKFAGKAPQHDDCTMIILKEDVPA